MKYSLSRKDDHRKMMTRNLVTSLILYEEMRTTVAKAKAIKPVTEHLIHIAKKNDLQSRRIVLKNLLDKKAAQKIFEILIKRYQKLSSGYVSITRIGRRVGDGAEMVIIRLKPEEIKKEELDLKEIEKVAKKEKNASSPKTETDKDAPESAKPVKTK